MKSSQHGETTLHFHSELAEKILTDNGTEFKKLSVCRSGERAGS